MKTSIIKVQTKRQLTQFIDFPHDLYEGDPNYVPMIYMEQEALLNPKKSPFLKHSKADYFLAVGENGKILGRIAAIRNNNHLEFTGTKEGFFGFFDVVNDYEVAKMLLDTACDWLRTEGLNKVIGPMNFSTNETCGLLIENFDEPPYIMMTYNSPYYLDLLEKYGFVKNMDLLAYKIEHNDLPQKVMDFAEKLEERLASRGIVIRKINMKNYWQELENFLPVYNESWTENTGFVPMTAEEVKQIAKDLKPVIDPDWIYFAEKNGETIGVSLAVPNVNEVQIRVKRGRLFPTGALKILFGLKKIKTVRIIALGIKKEYRRLGIDACFYVRNIKAGLEKGYTTGEGSWILENNDRMNRAIQHINGKVYRKYRLVEKDI